MRQPSALLLILDSASSIRPFRLLWNALHDRQVAFLDDTRLESLGKSLVRLGIAGQQQASARVPVQPVDRLRQPLETELQSAQIIFKAFPRARAGMHCQPRRLVDHQGLGVFEENSFIPHRSALPPLLHRRNVCDSSDSKPLIYAELTF
jgi:hypothetical protein